jgi:phytoene desaturase
MQNLAEELGVRFLFGEEAKAIVIEKGKAKKLVTDKGEYTAEVIISGADYHFTEQHLLPADYRTYTEAYWQKRVLAPSCLIFYVGLNTRLKDVLHHSLFFDVTFEKHANEIYTDKQWPTEPLFYLSVTSQTDPHVAPEGGENLFILIPVAAGLDGDTPAIREKYFQMVIQRIEQRTGKPLKIISYIRKAIPYLILKTITIPLKAMPMDWPIPFCKLLFLNHPARVKR